MDFKNIPIIILSYNRVSCLRDQITAFESRGYRNLVILDNNSAYPPLLEYYKTIPYEIIRLKENYGHTAFITQGVVRRFMGDWYAYTDPDIIPSEECPDDFMEHFHNLLMRHPQCLKAGFGLRIDDIPDHYLYKDELVGWEQQYWKMPVESEAYLAPIDTTFGLCRPGTAAVWAWSIRTGNPYTARHTSWYLDLKNLSEEEIHYTNNLLGGDTHWSAKNRLS
jgi:GT2 family glycosyltransferase